MTPKELINSILQLAIQGKLVEQRPEEGTAAELYQHIQDSKQLLEIVEDDLPFDIPESWRWGKLQHFANINGGYAFKSTNYMPNGVRVVRISDFNEDGFVNYKIVRHAYDDTLSPFLVEKNNILLCMTGGTVGKSLFVKLLEEKMMVNQRVAKIKINDILPEYAYIVILAPLTKAVIQHSKNSTNDNISMETINNFLIPLPPLAEQKRIVAKIEELLPYIDRYEQAWSKLEDFNRRFPTDLQKSILQMAIQGKLAEQRPEEGTGEELYQQIQAEKQRLIKAGTIKKEKNLQEIAEDEKPFDIPESWKWIRMRDITENIGDGIHGTPEFEPNGGYYFINGNNLDDGKISFKADTQQVNELQYVKYKKPLTLNSILISINGTIGNIAYYNNEPVILGKSACYIALIKCVHKNYIRTLLESQFFLDYASREATQTTIKNVSLKAIRMLPVPLPPLAEQKRIVSKLEEILPLCKKLKK